MQHLRLTQRIVPATHNGPVTIEIKGQKTGPGGCRTEAEKLAQVMFDNLPQHTIDHLRGLLNARANEPGEVEAEPPAKGCKNHKFVLAGVKYESDNVLITYYHWFYCRNCLHIEYRQFHREFILSNWVKFNATPK